MKLISIIALLFFAMPAMAQQMDSAQLQRLLTVLEQQRNTALNQAAISEAKAAQLTEENQRLKADLEKAQKANGNSGDR